VDRSRARRCVESIVFVAAVIAIGVVFDMSPPLYVAFSFPATVFFQLVMRRERLEELWVRGGPKLTRQTAIPAVAGLLALAPAIALVTNAYGRAADMVIYLLVLIIGAVPASYAIRHADRETMRLALRCFLTAGVIGALLFSLDWIHEVFNSTDAKGSLAEAQNDLLRFLESVVVLAPSYFVVEEVTFRGGVDSHVHHPGERHGVISAIFVSLLWGTWHYPIIPHETVGEVLASMFVLQGLVGPFLSMAWRRSGNLLAPAITHDFLDSFRNATVGAPD
jgi:membrane protease YdiL (CAAX protease family)